MKTELLYLVLTTTLTGLIWIPYIIDRIAVWGLTTAVGYPENPKPQSPWARRMMAAHENAVENLVVFAGLVLAGSATAPRPPRAWRTFGRASCTSPPIRLPCPGSARSRSRWVFSLI